MMTGACTRTDSWSVQHARSAVRIQTMTSMSCYVAIGRPGGPRAEANLIGTPRRTPRRWNATAAGRSNSPVTVQRRCDRERRRVRPGHLGPEDPLRNRVIADLRPGRSPEAIWAALDADDNHPPRVERSPQGHQKSKEANRSHQRARPPADDNHFHYAVHPTSPEHKTRTKQIPQRRVTQTSCIKRRPLEDYIIKTPQLPELHRLLPPQPPTHRGFHEPSPFTVTHSVLQSVAFRPSYCITRKPLPSRLS